MPHWIDTHMHLWDPAEMHYPWLTEEPSLNRAYLPDDLDTGGHDLAGVVVVEAGRLPSESLREAQWITDLAAAWPRILAVVAHAPVQLGDGVRPWLDSLSQQALVTGVRRNIQDEAPGAALTDGFIRGVRLIADYGYTFDLCVRHWQLREVSELVARVPDVVFVLDHLGKPAVAERLLDPWREDIRRLAGHPNVVCKLSGLTTEADHERWRYQDVRPYLRHVLDEFGPDRTMFGGDWPVATLATSYGRWVEAVAAVIGDLTAAQRRAVRSATAGRVYRLGLR